MDGSVTATAETRVAPVLRALLAYCFFPRVTTLMGTALLQGGEKRKKYAPLILQLDRYISMFMATQLCRGRGVFLTPLVAYTTGTLETITIKRHRPVDMVGGIC